MAFIFLSTWAHAQLKPVYSTGNSHDIIYGNPSSSNDGQYSGSFLSPVGQGGAGKNPDEVKTTYFAGFGYTGKTLKEKNEEALVRDETDLNSKYSAQVFSLFENNYFPNENWDGAPLVEKIYDILEGINGDPNIAKDKAEKHRQFFPTSAQDLAYWGTDVTEQQFKDRYKSYYNKLPTDQEVKDFINTFYAIKNSITWSGLCHQFSAANADPFITNKMAEMYQRDGEVFLCEKPISLGELKEATTLMYDSIDIHEQLGNKITLRPFKEPKNNNLKAEDINFYKKYATGSEISAEERENVHSRKYATYLYQNLYERNGTNPSGLGFCDLDKKLLQTERQEYSSQTENFTKNKVPILNLSGDGEVWNNPVTNVTRDVLPYNFYNGSSITPSDVGQPLTSNSFSEMMRVYVDWKINGKEDTPTFKRMQQMLIRNYNVICEYARNNNMPSAITDCRNIFNNQIIDAPAPGRDNIHEWSAFPQVLKNQNDNVDKSIFNLVKSFILFDDSNKPMRDSNNLPRMRSLDAPYFNKFKIQDVSLKVNYVNESDFADDKKKAKIDQKTYEGLVLVDDSVSPPNPVGCSWKSVWRYNQNLNQYESNMPASLLTLDIPSCPTNTKAAKLLDQVSKCVTMKELIKSYNQWMLEASQGFEPAKISAEIDLFKEKFPESNIDWVRLKEQILGEMDDKFIEESKE